MGEGGPLGAADDVLGVFAFALEEHVGFADGVGLGVDLLAVEAGLDGFAAGGGELAKGLLGDGEHAAGAAGAVVEQVGAGLDFFRDGLEHEAGHEFDGVAGCPVFTGLLVVILVEAADQLLEDGAHGVVVEAGVAEGAVGVANGLGGEVDLGVEELGDEAAEGIGARERGELVAEFEVFEDVLNVFGEAVEVVLKVGEELLLGCAGLQVSQGKLGGVVEGLAGGGGEGGGLLGDAGGVEHGLGVQDGLFGGLEDGIHAAEDAHGQDDVWVFAALEKIAEDIVGDAPEEGDDLVVGGLVHGEIRRLVGLGESYGKNYCTVIRTRSQLNE